MLIWIAVLIIFALGFWLVLHKHDEKTTAKTSRGAGGGPVTINTATAQKGDIGVYLDGIGTVTPVYTASITSQVNGTVTAVHYKEGQVVHQGDPLIDIDDRTYRATLLQAQGTLERDQNVLGQAQMDLQRYKDAWARNAIPKQTLDDQEKVVLQDQGTVKLDQGMVNYDQVEVEYCHINAPFTGKVGLWLVDLGQVQPRLQQHAKLTVDAYDRAGQKKIASGTLLTLDNQIDTTTGTVKARASFDNKGFSLFPNEFVNVRLLVNTIQNATLIPTSTIQYNGQTAFVYVIQDNTAHMRTIKPGVADGGTEQVTGINPGDVLANTSFDKLQDNSKVVISNKAVPASAAQGSNAP